MLIHKGHAYSPPVNVVVDRVRDAHGIRDFDMPRTVTYRLFSPQTASLAGAATIQVVQPGRIVGVTMGISGTGGATAGTYHDQVEVNQANALFNTVNSPPREPVLASLSLAMAITTPATANGPSVPQNVQIRAGDIISLNVQLVGTAGTSMAHWANVCVQENGG